MAIAVGGTLEPNLVVENLSVWFADKPVLTDVGLSLWPGQIAVIVGPSGSGKTTLIRSINRLNECHPNCRTEGAVRIRLDGRSGDVYRDFLPLPELRRKAGMVFQTPAVLPFSIDKNLRMPLRVTLGLTGTRLTERVEWALREVALWDEVKDRLGEAAATLSGGQQQRLCIARALAVEPDVILMDEPASALDPISTTRIEDLMQELKRDYTIVIVTHNMQQA
ncbi:MAG TPA: phosphate ABC transporter ATP-binding protein, partial [Syntrophobacteraceae bacterium]|nr:phosphate ABC transporter ATP-binding protein [Syntrophobacteraceae bacterium]